MHTRQSLLSTYATESSRLLKIVDMYPIFIPNSKVLVYLRAHRPWERSAFVDESVKNRQTVKFLGSSEFPRSRMEVIGLYLFIHSSVIRFLSRSRSTCHSELVPSDHYLDIRVCGRISYTVDSCGRVLRWWLLTPWRLVAVSSFEWFWYWEIDWISLIGCVVEVDEGRHDALIKFSVMIVYLYSIQNILERNI